MRHLAGRVWLCPGDPDADAVQAGVAVVADERGSVMIDAGQSPAHAAEIRAAASSREAQRAWRSGCARFQVRIRSG
ncbi:MAG: hypothetical protein ABW022_03970 [Actinoplanes sp.]